MHILFRFIAVLPPSVQIDNGEMFTTATPSGTFDVGGMGGDDMEQSLANISLSMGSPQTSASTQGPLCCLVIGSCVTDPTTGTKCRHIKSFPVGARASLSPLVCPRVLLESVAAVLMCERCEGTGILGPVSMHWRGGRIDGEHRVLLRSPRIA